MRLYRDSISEAPEELTGIFAFVTVPPGPPFPEELHLQKVAGVIWCWAGRPERAGEVLAPFRALGPALDGVGEIPYPAIQTAFDALYPAGLQNYWRGHVFDELPDEAIERHVDGASRLPTPLSGVLVRRWSSALSQMVVSPGGVRGAPVTIESPGCKRLALRNSRGSRPRATAISSTIDSTANVDWNEPKPRIEPATCEVVCIARDQMSARGARYTPVPQMPVTLQT